MNEYISSVLLDSNEFNVISVLEIKAIPDRSITIYADDVEANTGYQLLFKRLMDEIYQLFKVDNNTRKKDIACELLFLTKPAENQIFIANINIYFILRVISSNKTDAVKLLEQMQTTLSSNLTLNMYEINNISYFDLIDLMSTVKSQEIYSIRKEERIENLQNQMFSQYYGYDLFNNDYSNMDQFLNSLSRIPNVAVSFQLIPTVFTENEKSVITSTCQSLGILDRGMTDPTLGHISVESASKAYNNYLYYLNNRNSSLFLFNIIIFSNDKSAKEIFASLFEQLSGQNNSQLRIECVENIALNIKEDYYYIPWMINEILLGLNRGVLFNNRSVFERLSFIVTTEESSSFFRIPIKTEKNGLGLTINDSIRFNKKYATNLLNAGDISIGVMKSSENKDTIGLSLNDLTKHMLIVGTPGSGKTTFSVGLLDRLWKEHQIPFLVIEPAKNEYRALVESIPDIQIFTPGKNYISPFVLNPFVPPKNVVLETYKPTLKTAFAAAIPLTTPLDLIFEQTINSCYSKFRWIDTYTSDNKGIIFNISDFIKCFEETFNKIGYTGEAQNIGRAGKVRLKSLLKLFDNYYSIPIEDILSKPTIIELAAIENSEEKALIISLLLLSIVSFVNSNYISEGKLKNFILIEEAHVLLEQDESSASVIAQGLLKRMLAEMRSYGIGMGIADQSPRKVSADVVALTDIKIIFRLVEGSDKKIIEESTNMNEIQTNKLAKLKPGEAFLFFNRLDDVEEIKIDNYRLNKKIKISLSDKEIAELSTYWKLQSGKLRPYPECKLTMFCSEKCIFGNRVLAKEVANRIFLKHFNLKSDYTTVKKCFGNISTLIKAELNDEKFSKELLSCVMVHLFRLIKYETKIEISKIVVENTLKI